MWEHRNYTKIYLVLLFSDITLEYQHLKYLFDINEYESLT